MSFATGVYLGLVNLAAITFIRPWPLTLLGSAAALLSTNLTLHHLLKQGTSRATPWLVIASGATVLCAGSLVPTAPLEVIPYALSYLTLITLPYICWNGRRRSTLVPESPSSVVVEKVISTEIPLGVATPPQEVSSPEIALDQPASFVITVTPSTDDEYDHVSEEESFLP